ncbi:unnamed protein product [Strongylus vulgaris]|uniref:Uncharacterized protein n=1 Tax=Strongylus vulgaris TaxID=40348 RepID=A0A3P7IIH2_STRVU|nr:unnamed protein product [Strongylus vulgaris]
MQLSLRSLHPRTRKHLATRASLLRSISPQQLLESASNLFLASYPWTITLPIQVIASIIMFSS